MFNILPLVLILLALSTIIFIVVRKFSVLANLDVETIPAEREAKFKERIIGNKIKRSFYKYFNRFFRFLSPLGGKINELFKLIYKKLLDFKESNKEEEKIKVEDTEQAIIRMFAEADNFIKDENFDEAEKRYIEIISLDSKNIVAFKKLAKVYFDRKDFNEAKQTYNHVLKLLEKDLGELSEAQSEDQNTQISEIYFELAKTEKEIGNNEEAQKAIQEALTNEPNNPRYLDTLIEISIINKNKEIARDALKRLKKANPENQKLTDIKKQIDEL